MKDFSRIVLRAFVTCALVVGMMPSFAWAEDASAASATEAASNAGSSSPDSNGLPPDGVRQDQSAAQQELSAQSDTSVAGEEGTSGGCSWKLDDNGNMTVWPTDGQSGTLGLSNFPWKERKDVKTVTFKPGVKATGDCSYMFYDCSNLTSVDFSDLDTSQVTNMKHMFMQCYALSSLDLSGFDTSIVTDMQYMFVNCNSLTSVDVSSFDTSQVWSMRGMFSLCWSLASVDVSTFDTSQVADMTYMFYSCSSLKTIYASENFKAVQVPSSDMFTAASALIGGAGTTYDANYINRSGACIDKPGGTTWGIDKGYFTGADPMHRVYNPYSGEHFYTADDSEKDHLVSVGWTYEGIGWTAPTSGDPVYRLYNRFGGEHHYTLNAAERDNLIAAGWEDEGIGWYSDVNKTVPVYRQYNPYAFANNHNYTTDTAERDMLIGLGWLDEDIAWYGVSGQ